VEKGWAILLNLQKVVDGNTSNNMTSMIMGNLVKFGGLIENDLAKKLISFGIDGVMVFQGAKTKVTM
jgi:hypothetical protein